MYIAELNTYICIVSARIIEVQWRYYANTHPTANKMCKYLSRLGQDSSLAFSTTYRYNSTYLYTCVPSSPAARPLFELGSSLNALRAASWVLCLFVWLTVLFGLWTRINEHRNRVSTLHHPTTPHRSHCGSVHLGGSAFHLTTMTQRHNNTTTQLKVLSAFARRIAQRRSRNDLSAATYICVCACVSGVLETCHSPLESELTYACVGFTPRGRKQKCLPWW